MNSRSITFVLLASTRGIIKIAAFMGGGMFNDGYKFVLRVMNDLELLIGLECKNFADTYDWNRVKREGQR